MIKLDMHTSCCGSLLKPLADIWDGSLLDSFEFFFTSSPSWDGWNTREKSPTVKRLTSLRWKVISNRRRLHTHVWPLNDTITASFPEAIQANEANGEKTWVSVGGPLPQRA